MTGKKMLSMVALVSLTIGLPAGALALEGEEQPPTRLASIMTTAPKQGARPGGSAEILASHRDDGPRSVSVGFVASGVLRDRLRGQLGRFADYRVSDTPQIPAGPSGMHVGGHVLQMDETDGWMNCRVRYFVASQPESRTQFIETVAASVPILQVRIFKDRPEVKMLASEACLDEVAQQIVARLSS